MSRPLNPVAAPPPAPAPSAPSAPSSPAPARRAPAPSSSAPGPSAPRGPASQDPPPSAAPQASAKASPRYRSAQPLARLASICISLAMLVIGLEIAWTGVTALASIGLAPSPPAGWTGVERGENALITLYFSALIFGAVTFIRCQRRLIRNLQALGKPAPALDWATFSWFIPVISLIAPFLAFRQIADGSKVGGRGLKPLISAWWLSWLLADVVAVTAGVIFTVGGTMHSWMWAAALEFGAGSLQLISGVLAILLLFRLSQQQDTLAQEISA